MLPFCFSTSAMRGERLGFGGVQGPRLEHRETWGTLRGEEARSVEGVGVLRLRRAIGYCRSSCSAQDDTEVGIRSRGPEADSSLCSE
jgi:hypothetical protein